MTALDEAGNESEASAARYLNFALLPVADLAIELGKDAFPELVWSHSGATIAGYDVYRGDTLSGTKLNDSGLVASMLVS